MAAGLERAEGTFRSVKLGRAKGKAEGRRGDASMECGELWLIGRKTVAAASPLADIGAGAGRCAAPGSTSMPGPCFGLPVKTPLDSLWLGWGAVQTLAENGVSEFHENAKP